MVGVSNLRGMEVRSLIVSAWSSSDGSGSASLDYGLWELCFSLVSPLWELCYSLASCQGIFFGEGGAFHVSPSPFSVFLLSSSFPSPFFHLFPFFLLPFILSFSFVVSIFFFEGTACTVCFYDVDDDARDCSPIVIRLYFNCNKERLFLSCL